MKLAHLACPVALVAAVLCGCETFERSPSEWWSLKPFRSARSQSPDESDAIKLDTTVETPLIGEKTTVAGLNPITIYGVGLVTGLDGTGSDPPPSVLRDKIADEMRRRNVQFPNEILRGTDTALVIVKAYLPPLVSKGERFDVEVSLPEGSQTTSLNGGWLMETILSEQALVPGQGFLKGHVYAKAEGPILVAPGGEPASSGFRGGRVLGGGTSLKDRDLTMYLRNDFALFRNSIQIAKQIGGRFYDYNQYGAREPLAEAKTHQRIVLKVLPKYKDNYPRYLQVIRHIPFHETEVARQVRMQHLKEELNKPETAARASLALEAIGSEAIPFLKTGLANQSLEVRFHAAMALAYLGEPAAIEPLAEAARAEPAFRVYAFAGLAASDSAEAHMRLRGLLDDESAEVRYGAWRALTTLDPHDQFVQGEKINDEFGFHVVDSQADPLVHVTRRRQAEVVLFGADQRLAAPVAVRAGPHVLVNARPGSGTVVVSRYTVGRPDRRREVSTRLADVIRAASEVGATYPDIVQMLMQLEQQHNLPGRFALDALPLAGRMYLRPADPAAGAAPLQTRVGSRHLSPNLFGGVEEPDGSAVEPDGSEGATAPDESDQFGDAGETGASFVMEQPSGGHASVVDVTPPIAGADSNSQDGAGDEPRRQWFPRLRWFGGQQEEPELP